MSETSIVGQSCKDAAILAANWCLHCAETQLSPSVKYYICEIAISH